MMKHIAFILIALLLMGGCTEKTAGETALKGKLKVTVSILPQAFIVKSIGGNLVDVNVMVPPAASPETYEPGPVKMAELKNSDIYFMIGMPFEMSFINKIKKEYPSVRFTDMKQGIKLRDMESHHHHDSEAAVLPEEIKDPHVWLDPVILVQMAQNTVNELIRVDPKNSEIYIDNAINLKKQLQLLNDEMVDLFKGLGKKSFVIYHPAWGYFADRYGIRQIAVEIEGKEPSASEMAELMDLVKGNHVKYIFLEAQSPEFVVKSISAETGVQIRTLDPLKENVIENIRESAQIIKEGLVYARNR